jgi:hypothetical protein
MQGVNLLSKPLNKTSNHNQQRMFARLHPILSIQIIMIICNSR